MTRRLLGLVLLTAAVLLVIGPLPAAESCKPYDSGCEYCDSPYYQMADEICITRTWTCGFGGGSDTYCW
ncbi:MAG TPA: hypothetical protein PK435_14195 [Thermoanaerobaculaceae bacterium]|nr:hypothetical protein [Thermoanaerobaculaceae bacterium]